MGKATEDAEGVKSKIVAASRAPLIITLVVITFVGGAYYAFYRSQVEYYTGRNLRLVSTLTAQINGRVGMYSRFFREGILKPDVNRSRAGRDASSPQAEAVGERIRRGLKESGRGWALHLQDEKGVEATVPLDDVLRPIFARRVGAAFDMVLVADGAGNIVYSVRTPPRASSLLTNEDEPLDDEEKEVSARTVAMTGPANRPEAIRSANRTAAMIRSAKRARKERESGSALVITQLSAMSERKGWREYTSLNPASLLVATEQLRVRLGDAEYLLFTQPYVFASKSESLSARAQPWIVCGLVAAPRFRYDVSAVSASIVLTAVGIALLALCCWPFLRIALIHPNQELTITDVALIVICTAVGAAVLALGMLDVFAYRTLAAKADKQLQEFGETVVTDFGDNVQRAMTVLSLAQKVTQPLLPADEKPEKISRSLPELTPEIIGKYPYIDSIAWIDGTGKQHVRFAADNTEPLSDVGQRQYFRDAAHDRTWKVKDQRYVLEWVRSRATGEVRAVLAKTTGDPKLPVIALATDLIDVTYAVRPPGVELAIIDETGEVVYHSDNERIGFENFYTETDRNRDLRSAVLARRASTVRASYWGEDKSMYVSPLTGSQWTLVAYRAARLTRVLNVEAALLTIVLLMICAAPYLLLYIFAFIALPRYRAPSIWPDEARRGDYLRLCIIYLGLLLLFGLTTFVLTPWSSFYAVMMIPAIAILSTYLVLHRVGTPRRFAIATALWIGANAILFSVLLRYGSWVAKAVLLGVAVAVAALTAMLMSTSGGRRLVLFVLSRVQLGYTTLYRVCGVLILVLCAALPVAAFFNISRHVQSELLVKYGQLRAAADLEHRIDRIETLNVQDSTPDVYYDVLGTDNRETIFGNPWVLQPASPTWPARRSREPVACDPPTDPTETTNWTVPQGAANLLPSLYEDSLAIRPLFHTGTTDSLWHWCVNEESITLVRSVRFDVDVSKKLWPRQPTPTNQRIVISSPRAPVETGDGGGESVAAMLLCGIGLLVVFWYAAGFIASRVLLMDVTEPYWMARLPLSPSLGDHIFLVRRDKDAADLTGDDPMGKGLPFLDVSFENLAQTDSWNAALERLESSAAGQNVRIVDFEYGINDGAIQLKKLQWLGRLLSLPDRTVIVISTVGPAFIMSAPEPTENVPTDYLERWRALLDRFVIVTAEELELRHQEWKRRKEFRTLSQLKTGSPKSWLEKETANNPFLRRLRDELDPTIDRPHLLDEIAERAETYYAGLWATCRQDEKLLLDQLARNGLANGRNRRTLRRLIARGLVRRDPNLELFSETFRLYVLAAAQRENLVSRAHAERGASTWDSLRLPFFIIIISFLILLFATQKDLLTSTTALATALTTGLPLIMKLIGVFTEKRMGAPDRA